MASNSRRAQGQDQKIEGSGIGRRGTFALSTALCHLLVISSMCLPAAAVTPHMWCDATSAAEGAHVRLGITCTVEWSDLTCSEGAQEDVGDALLEKWHNLGVVF